MLGVERALRRHRERHADREVEWEMVLSVVASVEAFLLDRDRGIVQGRYRADSNDLDVAKEEAMRDELRGLVRAITNSDSYAPAQPAGA